MVVVHGSPWVSLRRRGASCLAVHHHLHHHFHHVHALRQHVVVTLHALNAAFGAHATHPHRGLAALHLPHHVHAVLHGLHVVGHQGLALFRGLGRHHLVVHLLHRLHHGVHLRRRRGAGCGSRPLCRLCCGLRWCLDRGGRCRSACGMMCRMVLVRRGGLGERTGGKRGGGSENENRTHGYLLKM